MLELPFLQIPILTQSKKDSKLIKQQEVRRRIDREEIKS